MRNLIAVACGLLSAVAGAQDGAPSLSLVPVFGDNMVLQRGCEVPIWGQAQPRATVAVTFAGKTRSTAADDQGAWRVRLAPLEASSTPAELRVSCGDQGPELVLTNVVVGDVWVCSGQSNMAGLLRNHAQARSDDVPLLRQYSHRPRRRGGKAAPNEWVAANPADRDGFSSTAYFFGRRLHHELGVPIGLLTEAASGSLIETWIPREALLADPALAPIIASQPAEASLATGERDAFVTVKSAGHHFAASIRPLVPYAIKGVIWYQGEANARTAASARPYGRMLSLLIRTWREAWAADELPFYYVQLPSIADPQRCYDLVREQMLRTLDTLPHVGMAVAIDVNEGLHPQSKHIIGERLALLALRNTYQRDLVASGPLYRGMELAEGRVLCRFGETGGGLVAKGGTLTGFEVAGEDRVFAPADAVIEGDAVAVSRAGLAKPLAARYAWANAVPQVTLYNREGLPASPFRTDDW